MSHVPDISVKPRDFPWTPYWVLLGVIGFIAALPIITMIVSIALIVVNGCSLNESSTGMCMIGGVNAAAALQLGVFSAFFLIVTVPVGLVLFLIWLVILLSHRSRARSRGVA